MRPGSSAMESPKIFPSSLQQSQIHAQYSEAVGGMATEEGFADDTAMQVHPAGQLAFPFCFLQLTLCAK